MLNTLLPIPPTAFVYSVYISRSSDCGIIIRVIVEDLTFTWKENFALKRQACKNTK